jgi:hypothetical protein
MQYLVNSIFFKITYLIHLWRNLVALLEAQTGLWGWSSRIQKEDWADPWYRADSGGSTLKWSLFNIINMDLYSSKRAASPGNNNLSLHWYFLTTTLRFC